MKETQKHGILCWVLAALLAYGAYDLFPGTPWWVDLAVAAIIAGALYQKILAQIASDKIIDRGDWPNRG